jgi:hypothetical protein
MIELTDKQIIEYLHRCFTAVDGLWFVKLEENTGFYTALETDVEVWKIMPKIQARLLKSMANLGDGIDALFECFTFKMKIEGYEFTTETLEGNRGFRVRVTKCPWSAAMVKAGRKNLAGDVGTAICISHHPAWAAEFGEDIKFRLLSQKCTGAGQCVLEFSR